MRIVRYLALTALLVSTIALAHSDGIYNPKANSVGNFEGIDSNQASSGSTLACSYSPVTTGTQNVAYTGATPAASGGVPAYTFSETGALPSGLTISSITGVISGTPSVSGTFTGIQVKVADTASTTVNCGASFTLVVSPPASFSLTFGDIQNSVSHTTTVTYTAMNYGSGNTAVVAAVYSAGPATITSVTINGVACTAITNASAITGGVNLLVQLWQSNTAVSGSSGNVVVVYATAISDNSVVALYNLVTSTPTPSNGYNTANSSTSSLNLPAVVVPAGGGGIVAVNTYQGGGASTIAFTNATKDHAQVAGGTVGADIGHTTSTGSVSVTATISPSANAVSMVASTWSP